MAPFGKNFLKARLKNRNKDIEAVPGKEIQVSVFDEEKVVCGVTKHTTCADIVQALLDDHKTIPESKRLLHGDCKDFCLLERWKGFERALPPLTRILRLWNAWGDQKPFIQFILVKTSDVVPQTGKRCSKSKGAKPKTWEKGPTHYSQSMPVERQKRMVKKAFRKLEKIHKEKETTPGAAEIDRMVQLIISQDHTIRQQVQRMRDLDLEIERGKLQVGQEVDNLSKLSTPPTQSMGFQNEDPLQDYLYSRDGVEQLELQLQRHQDLILQLSHDINAELMSGTFAWPEVPEEEVQPQGATAAALSQASFDLDLSSHVPELERLQSELKYSLCTGVSLHSQTMELEKELKRYDMTISSKDQECWQLATQLCSLQLEESVKETPRSGTLKGLAHCSVPQHVKLKHNLSPTDITDTDSDTGISSTHSQDSLLPCLDSLPPLDSDV
ncbi:ras association domain-containing protein 9 [Osmerus mordax]|uniref:ras association domain-containing protein 9 n=1 Tax=Osmerus mordax TaxID=8014 RepID=UPI003510C684